MRHIQELGVVLVPDALPTLVQALRIVEHKRHAQVLEIQKAALSNLRYFPDAAYPGGGVDIAGGGNVALGGESLENIGGCASAGSGAGTGASGAAKTATGQNVRFRAIPTFVESQKSNVANCVAHCKQQINSPWSSTFGKVHKALAAIRSGEAAPFETAATKNTTTKNRKRQGIGGKVKARGKGKSGGSAAVKDRQSGGGGWGGDKKKKSSTLDEDTLLAVAAEYCMFFLGGSKWRAKQLQFEEGGSSSSSSSSSSDSESSSCSDHAGCSGGGGNGDDIGGEEAGETKGGEKVKRRRKKQKKKAPETEAAASASATAAAEPAKAVATTARTAPIGRGAEGVGKEVAAALGDGSKPAAKRQRVEAATIAIASTTAVTPTTASTVPTSSATDAVATSTTTDIEAFAYGSGNDSKHRSSGAVAGKDAIECKMYMPPPPTAASSRPSQHRSVLSAAAGAVSVSARQLAGCLPWTGAIPWCGKLDVKDKRAVGRWGESLVYVACSPPYILLVNSSAGAYSCAPTNR